MVTQPPPFPDGSPITKGIGKLTPAVWDSFIWSASWLHENVNNLNDVMKASKLEGQVTRPWFLAKIRNAKLVAPNQYKYSWIKVKFGTWSGSTIHEYEEDDSLSSTGTQALDAEYQRYAVNLVESANTGEYTGTGTDESASTFPVALHMQAIGGGYTEEVDEEVTSYLHPIVQMFVWRDKEYKAVYYFTAANSYDGGCEEPDP